jgi:hypothetical protein
MVRPPVYIDNFFQSYVEQRETQTKEAVLCAEFFLHGGQPLFCRPMHKFLHCQSYYNNHWSRLGLVVPRILEAIQYDLHGDRIVQVT